MNGGRRGQGNGELEARRTRSGIKNVVHLGISLKIKMMNNCAYIESWYKTC